MGGQQAKVDFGGNIVDVHTGIVDCEVGDYVLVHAGYAIEIVSEQFAQETLDLISQFPELAESL
jgi:hydrogenase expression/formation protein HypC